MFTSKRNTASFPPAKPNGDTNRDLIDIEIALARDMGFEKNIIVFNVIGQSWLLNIAHECDMVVVSPKSRLLCEYEIKRTWQDFCADFKKHHQHNTGNGIDISSFSFVVPDGLYERAVRKLQEEKIVVTGIITYNEELVFKRHTCLWSYNPQDEGKWRTSTYHNLDKNDLKVEDVRKGVEAGRYFLLDFQYGDKPTIIPTANPHPLFTEQLLELARLGCMRQVSLRERIQKLESEII